MSPSDLSEASVSAPGAASVPHEARRFGRYRLRYLLGAGGMANPGSFKGYVPSFWGRDFDDLVRDDAELRQWLRDGKIARIADHPVGGWFFRRQALKMPAYGSRLTDEEIDALVAYVRWIRNGPWRSELR